MRRPSKNRSEAKIDIHDVAAHARVSIATVSRTINHVQSVDPVLAARVWKAVADLNYLPNTQARALVSGKSRLLGLIVSEITNPFFPELIQEFERAAVARGYEILIGSTSYDTEKMESCARRMLERKVDGVAIMTFGIEGFLLDRFAAEELPMVLIDEAQERVRCSTLQIGYRAGIQEGVEHLRALGHRQIGFIAGPLRLRSAALRRAAFLDAMQVAELASEPEWVVESDHTLEGGRDTMRRLLTMQRRPTALLCSNDMTAIGVQHALFEAGARVPDDLSLIGFDDIHLAEYTIPPLTTVRMACTDLAEQAVACLLWSLGQDLAATRQPAEIVTRLIVRQTTGPPRSA